MPSGVWTRPGIRERFNTKWELDPQTGCHLWVGSVNNSGYGQIKHDGKTVSAHRISWLLSTGELPPPGVCVCHHCDTKLCVKFACLFLGTHKENTADMLAKGRHYVIQGEDHWRAAKTDAEIAEIRRLYAAGGVTMRELASRFQCGLTTVGQFILRTRRA
jgi:hypothetical protein